MATVAAYFYLVLFDESGNRITTQNTYTQAVRDHSSVQHCTTSEYPPNGSDVSTTYWDSTKLCYFGYRSGVTANRDYRIGAIESFTSGGYRYSLVGVDSSLPNRIYSGSSALYTSPVDNGYFYYTTQWASGNNSRYLIYRQESISKDPDYERTGSTDVGTVNVGYAGTIAYSDSNGPILEPTRTSGPKIASSSNCSLGNLHVDFALVTGPFYRPTLSGEITPSASGSFSAEIVFDVLANAGQGNLYRYTITITGDTGGAPIYNVEDTGGTVRTVESAATGVTEYEQERSTYHSFSQITLYYRSTTVGSDLSGCSDFAVSVYSGDSDVVDGLELLSFNQRAYRVRFTPTDSGIAVLRFTYTYGSTRYYRDITIQVDPVARVYRAGWAYYSSYSEYQESDMRTNTYHDYAVGYGGSFDPIWCKTEGTKNDHYCENGVTSSGYPGGGSDSIQNITSDITIYPAEAQPVDFEVAVVSGNGHCEVYMVNNTTGMVWPTIYSGSIDVYAAPGDSVSIYTQNIDGGWVLRYYTRNGSEISGATSSPYTFNVGTSYEGDTIGVYVDYLTYTMSYSVSPSGYGTMTDENGNTGLTTHTITGVPANYIISTSGAQITVKGATVTAVPTAMTRQYTYVFSHWTVNGTTMVDGIGHTVLGDCTIRAVFTRRATVFTQRPSASWKSSDGSQTISEGDVKVGSSLTVRAESGGISLSGKDYLAEITDASGNTVAFASVSSTSLGTVYYAQITVAGVSVGECYIRFSWSSEDTTYGYYYTMLPLTVWVQYTISFNGNGGTPSTASMTTDKQGKLSSLPTATYDASHVLVGWFTDASGGTQVSPETVYSSSTTLYARWTVGYAVVYDPNGGGGGPGYEQSSDSAEYHDFIVPATLPTRAGYNFVEWNTKADGTGTGYDPGDRIRVTVSTPSATVYAQWEEAVLNFTLVYSNGGDSTVGNLPSSSSHTASIAPYETNVSSQIPTKSGETFFGWSSVNGSAWPEYLPGSRIELPAGTTTLYPVWESGSELMGAVDNVRIYKTVGGAYVDVSGRLAVRSRIHEVENYGATAEFTVVNKLSSNSQNYLSSSFSGWSDGTTGAIAPGMFVQIRDTSSSGYCWGTFMIMTLSVSDDLISVTCGDYIQVLRATGAEFFRNIYNASGYMNDRVAGVVGSAGSGYVIDIDRPSGVNLIGGSAGDVLYMVPDLTIFQSSQIDAFATAVTAVIYLGAVGASKRINGIVGIESLTLYLQSMAGTKIEYTIELYGGMGTSGTLLQSWNEDVTGQVGVYQEVVLNMSDPMDLSKFTYITVSVTGRYWLIDDHGSHWEYAVRACRTDVSGADASNYYITVGATTYLSSTLYCKVGGLEYHQATGTNTVYNSDPVFRITSIDSLSTIDTTQKLDVLVDENGSPTDGRGWIQYQDASANLYMDDVMENILDAPGAHLISVVTTKEVNMFRCGGDNYHNYMLALADMEDEGGAYDGRQHAFCALPGVWGSVNLGVRHRAEDASAKTLYYGGDTAVSGGQVMMSFAPRITKSNRPVIAMSKGAANDGVPLMVVVKDPGVDVGSSASVLESSVTTNLDAAFAAYSQIMTNRSQDWEGEVVLSGVHGEYMLRTGVYIGGVAVRINDTRYGMSSYKAKVKESTVDYQSLKTTLVLNNYSEVYSNSVLDTSKMAFQAGAFSAVATAAELYTRQFVFLETTQTLPTASTYTLGILIDGSTWTTVNADVIRYPELGIATVVGYFPYGADYSVTPYAVSAVRVNGGASIAIPEAKRPDRYAGQYLIVNVQMKI